MTSKGCIAIKGSRGDKQTQVCQGGRVGGATEGVLLFKSVQLYDMQKTATSENADILRGVYDGSE